MLDQINPYPVDSTTLTCGGGIGRHASECPGALHLVADLRAKILDDLQTVRRDVERMIRDAPEGARRTRLIQLGEELTQTINKLSIPFGAEARR